MIGTMPRPRPPYLHRVITRHGKAVWYVRLGAGQRKRIRLRSEFGTEDFRLEYEAALSGAPQSTRGAPASGTLAWLIERYREVSARTTLSLATRRQRENIFKHVLESAGDKRVRLNELRLRGPLEQPSHGIEEIAGLSWGRGPPLSACDYGRRRDRGQRPDPRCGEPAAENG